jgi:glucosamine--fructose-6-phosphate aminotransferase (isomerizing)
MCGIFGYVGPKNGAAEKILDGLKALEYRGYDSWGVAVVANNAIKIERKVGKIGDATVSLPDSNIGIGHTRWATHGGVTEANAHPHVDADGRIAVVHNGIVENYHELKIALIEKGHEFKSETDSEVIAHLIAQELSRGHSLKDTVCTVFEQLVGSNAICVLDKKSDSIAICRNGSPIIIGVGEDTCYVGSDVTPFLQYTNKVIFLNDGDCAILSRSGVSLYDLQSKKEKPADIEEINWKAEDAKKDGFPHYLVKEITEQIRTIPKTASLNTNEIQSLAKKIKSALHRYGPGVRSLRAFSKRRKRASIL